MSYISILSFVMMQLLHRITLAPNYAANISHPYHRCWALRFVHWDPELIACYLLEAQPCTFRCIMIGRNVQFVFDGSDVVIWRSASSTGGEAKTVYNVNFRNELFASSYFDNAK
jgi:hypothetical protein